MFHDRQEVGDWAESNRGQLGTYLSAFSTTPKGPWRVVGYSRGGIVPSCWFVIMERDEGDLDGVGADKLLKDGAQFLIKPVPGRTYALVSPGAIKLCEPAVVETKKFPHKCPRKGCGSPAYLGFNTIECSRKECRP